MRTIFCTKSGVLQRLPGAQTTQADATALPIDGGRSGEQITFSKAHHVCLSACGTCDALSKTAIGPGQEFWTQFADPSRWCRTADRGHKLHDGLASLARSPEHPASPSVRRQRLICSDSDRGAANSRRQHGILPEKWGGEEYSCTGGLESFVKGLFGPAEGEKASLARQTMLQILKRMRFLSPTRRSSLKL